MHVGEISLNGRLCPSSQVFVEFEAFSGIFLKSFVLNIVFENFIRSGIFAIFASFVEFFAFLEPFRDTQTGHSHLISNLTKSGQNVLAILTTTVNFAKIQSIVSEA